MKVGRTMGEGVHLMVASTTTTTTYIWAPFWPKSFSNKIFSRFYETTCNIYLNLKQNCIYNLVWADGEASNNCTCPEEFEFYSVRCQMGPKKCKIGCAWHVSKGNGSFSSIWTFSRRCKPLERCKTNVFPVSIFLCIRSC